MDIKGEITAVKNVNKKGKIFTLKNSSGTFIIKDATGKLFVKKGNKVSFINLGKKKGLLKTTYEITKETLVFLSPEIFVTDREMKLATFCPIAPIFVSLFGMNIKNEEKEYLFYKGIQGENPGNKFAKVASRYSKELKGKFSYSQFVYDKKTGFLAFDVLHFGKFPVVFSGDEKKGEILSLSSDTLKYVVIDPDTGTIHEKTIETEKAMALANERNEIVKNFLLIDKNYFKENIAEKCPTNCPAYEFCKKIDEKKNRKETFTEYLKTFLEKEIKFRNIYLKTLLTGKNPLTETTEVRIKSGNTLENKNIYELGILSNEATILNNDEAVITEWPPLDRKTIVSVKKVLFKNMEIKAKTKILTPELISPLPKKQPIMRGLFDFVYSNNSALPYISGEKKSSVYIYESRTFIANDELQNKAVNKIIDMHGILSISGERGTGKKYVLKTAISELTKYGKSFLILTQTRKEELKSSLKPELEEFIEKSGFVKIHSFEEKEIFTENSSFDYTVILLDGAVSKTLLQSFMGKSENVIFFSLPDFIPFEEKIPQSNKIRLLKEHRFGEHILHFLQPVMRDKVEPTQDMEIKPNEENKADKRFAQIIDPSKFVLFVNVKGKEFGINNKWNVEEGEFALLSVNEFIKAGIKLSQIEIIVPYERQKSFVKYILEKEKLGNEVIVALPSESAERDVVILSLTDTRKIGGAFADSTLLKIALTRARSKLIITGTRGIHKTSKFLSRIL